MKKLLVFLIPLLVVSLIVGCGKKPEVTPETKPTTEVEPVDTAAGTDEEGYKDTPVDRIPVSELAIVYFDFDKYNLREDAKQGLRHNVTIMKKYVDAKLVIEGHCDERGTVEYNLALGEKRARSARDYMVSLGIDGDRLTIISYGKERPVALGHDETSWAKNRRAEFIPVD